MKISTKARYGLKAIYILAENKNEVTSLASLSKEIGVGASYIEQLMRLLKQDGLIDSVRGATGGYMLLKEPSDITIGEILRSLEDNLSLVDCQSSGVCNSDCKTFRIWCVMRDAINNALDGITLQNMLEDKKGV